MSAATRLVTVALVEINCGKCGGVYAIGDRYYQQCREKGTAWNCPYCRCGWGFADGGENARLKREIESERKRTEWARQAAENERQRREAAEHRERAQKAAKTRLKNRIAHGVCPCCQRTFENVARHMATKHPGFTAAGGES